MGRQEQRAARQAAAAEAFERVWERALAVVKERADQRAEWARPEAMPDNEWDAACAVRILRDGGMAWWQLAHELALPGNGDSATTGKSGASYARRLYTKAFGDYERGTRATSAGAAERRAELAGPVFDGKTAEEVLAAVVGKELTWYVRAGDGVQGTDTAVVSPNGARLYGTDAISFHTAVYGEPEKGRTKQWMPGPERIVRISNIIQVGPGIPPGERVLSWTR